MMVVYVTPVFAPRWGFLTAGENPTVVIKQGVLRATSAQWFLADSYEIKRFLDVRLVSSDLGR